MSGVAVFAPAKINLALHVTGRRGDGYHLLDSLVAFAGVGDVLQARLSGQCTLTVSGPEAAGVPTDARNLVLQVADAFSTPGAPVSFHLDKRLPAAAGIGGGSADAAAAFRAIAMLRASQGGGPDPAAPDVAGRLVSIGADVPMCVTCEPARVQGIGERLTPLAGLPDLPVVLVNPRVPVPTGAVFSALDRRDNPPMEDPPADISDRPDLLAWLARQRNDLEPPARSLAPQVGLALAALQSTAGCHLARMSGSGATCFALYDTDAEADAAAAAVRQAHPGWWVASARLDGARRVAPRWLGPARTAP